MAVRCYHSSLGEPRILAAARYVSVHVLLFLFGNISLMFFINNIRFLCDCDLKSYLFPIRGSLAVRCCCSSLEGPAYPRLLSNLE